MACPRWPAFLQEAGNYEHGVEQKVSYLALCTEALRLIKTSLPAKQAIENLECFRPELRGLAQHLVNFAAHWGGKDGSMLARLDDWAKTMPGKRELCPLMLGRLASSASMASYPEWIEWCCFAAIAAPQRYVRKSNGQDVATLIDMSDCVHMSSSPVQDGWDFRCERARRFLLG